jgi:hypothetical protein
MTKPTFLSKSAGRFVTLFFAIFFGIFSVAFYLHKTTLNHQNSLSLPTVYGYITDDTDYNINTLTSLAQSIDNKAVVSKLSLPKPLPNLLNPPTNATALSILLTKDTQKTRSALLTKLKAYNSTIPWIPSPHNPGLTQKIKKLTKRSTWFFGLILLLIFMMALQYIPYLFDRSQLKIYQNLGYEGEDLLFSLKKQTLIAAIIGTFIGYTLSLILIVPATNMPFWQFDLFITTNRLILMSVPLCAWFLLFCFTHHYARRQLIKQ